MTDWAARAAARLEKAAVMLPEEWSPPPVGEFSSGMCLLAFDPALSKTGWVHLDTNRSRSGAVQFIARNKGTLRVRTEARGYLGTYDKASRMRNLITEVIWRENPSYFPPADIRWEAPAVRGHRTESSLIAGFLVYEACNGTGMAVSANHASKLLTGSARHDKKQIREAVARYVPEAAGREWTQDECDALAIALTSCHDAALVAEPGDIK